MPDKKSLLLTVAFILACVVSFGQDFEKQFKDLSATNDTTGQATILNQWEKARPNDAELFVAYFNFFVGKSMQELISLDRNKKVEQSLVLTTPGKDKPVAYLNSSVKYNSEILQKGFDYIDKGIAQHPKRLDLRFGKIYMLGEAENYKEFTKVIVETIEYGNKIKDAWMWKGSKPLEEPKSFFLSSMQNYVATIYNTEQDSLLPYMRHISEAVLKFNPGHVESLSNIALTYLITGQYNNALTYLLQAETINPKDIVVLNNIAEAYKRKKDNEKAKSYYEKIIRYGNKDEIEDAKSRLKELNN